MDEAADGECVAKVCSLCKFGDAGGEGFQWSFGGKQRAETREHILRKRSRGRGWEELEFFEARVGKRAGSEIIARERTDANGEDDEGGVDGAAPEEDVGFAGDPDGVGMVCGFG